MATKSYMESERADQDCECPFHLYQTVYICGCGKLVDHSQGSWNEHKTHPNGIDVSTEYYKHGDTAKSLFERMNMFGLLPYGTPELEHLWLLDLS